MITRKDFDLFIAYHGTNNETGSLNKAREIYDYLTAQGFNCFFNPISNADGAFVNTPIIARHCKLFLLVANPTLKVDQWGEITEDTPGLYNEVMAFYNLFFEKRGVRAGSARVFAYNGLTAMQANNLHIVFNGTAHFEESAGGKQRLEDWVIASLGKENPLASDNGESAKSPAIDRFTAILSKKSSEEKVENPFKQKNPFKIEAGVLKSYSGRDCVVEVPDGVTAISDYAFIGNKNLTEITLPDSVAVIGVHAFAMCEKLSVVKGGLGVVEIQKSAFSECANLEDFTFSSKLETIGASAFWGCKKLVRVVLPTSLKSVGANAFNDCAGLDIFSELGEKPLGYEYGWSGDSQVMWLGEKKRTSLPSDYTKIAKDGMVGVVKPVVMPEKPVKMPTPTPSSINLNGTTVIKGVTFVVQGGVLIRCSGYKNSIVVPEGITGLGKHVFAYQNELEEVFLPTTLKTIENDAFGTCEKITTLILPDSVEKIGDRAFLGCKSLTTLHLGSGLKELGKSVFTSCVELPSLLLPKSLTITQETLFLSCNKLTVYCEATSKPQGWHADWNKYNKPVVWGYKKSVAPAPEKVEKKSESALEHGKVKGETKSVTDNSFVVEPNFTGTKIIGGVTFKINNGVLISCAGYTDNVEIPMGVVGIGDRVFAYTKGIKKIVVPNTVKTIGTDAFVHCEEIVDMILPDSVEKIGDRAFLKCISLERLYLGAGIKELGKSVFTNCNSLPEIYFPKSLVKTGETLFLMCHKLTVYCEVDEKPAGWHVDWNKYNRPVVWNEEY